MTLLRLKEALKLGGDSSGKKAVHAAIEDIWALGYVNPFANKETVIDDAVAVDVGHFDNKVMLNSIRSFERGKGNATGVMHKLCAIADKHQVAMTVIAEPFGNEKVDKSKLIQWYQKFGFVLDEYSDDELTRTPR
jgi:hypothetical protein